MEDRTRRPLFAPALILGLSCLILAPTLIYPFGRDQGIFGYAGRAVLGGAVPFRDLWDPRPPALHYVYALAELLFGRSMASIRILDLLWQAATAVLVFLIALRVHGRRPAALAAGIACTLAYASLGWWNTAQSDTFISLPVAGAVLLTLRACDRDRALASLCAAGALIACAFYLKYPAGAMLPVCAAILFRRRGTHAAGGAAAMAAGFILVAGGYALYLAAAGAWREYWYAQFVWVRQYARLGGSAGGSLRLPALLNSHFGVVALGLLALAAAVRAAARRRIGLPVALVVLWTSVALLGLYLQNKFYLYHFGPLLAPLSIGAGAVLAAPFERGRGAGIRIAAAAAIAVAATIACAANPRYSVYCVRVYVDTVRSLAGRDPLAGYYRGTPDFPRFTSDDFSLPADFAVAEHLARNSAPTDTVFIWGYETLVYYLSGRRCPSRFIHNFPLRCPWTSPRFGEELLADLAREKPRYIAVLVNDPVWWVTGTREDSLQALGRHPGIARLIAERYAFEGRIEDFLLFRRREGGDGDVR